MEVLTLPELFNDEIITVFTDASSIAQKHGKYITASAVVVFLGNKIINTGVYSFKDSTISVAELFAVYQGVIMGYQVAKYYDKKISFLFSDSSFAISGLTNWLQSWIMKHDDGLFYNSSGGIVAHQHLFQSVISFINMTEYNVRLVKIRGHVSTDNNLSKAITYINNNNYAFSSVFLQRTVVHEISRRNNLVDEIARKSITDMTEEQQLSLPSAESAFPVHFLGINSADYNKYIKLINYTKGVRKENGRIYY